MARPTDSPARSPAAPKVATIGTCELCSVREISMCQDLAPGQLACLSGCMTTHAVTKGQPIFHEGDPAESLSNVIGGTVKLFKLLPDGRRQITGFLFPGDFLGVTFGDTHAFGAEAVTDVRLCRFARRDLETLMARFPALERRLLGTAGNELAAAHDQMLLLGRKTAREKLASFLVGLSRRARRRRQPENPVHLPMSRNDIADYLGLTTETVSRTFTEFRKAGVIRLLPHATVDVTRRVALEEQAEGAAPCVRS